MPSVVANDAGLAVEAPVAITTARADAGGFGCVPAIGDDLVVVVEPRYEPVYQKGVGRHRLEGVDCVGESRPHRLEQRLVGAW